MLNVLQIGASGIFLISRNSVQAEKVNTGYIGFSTNRHSVFPYRT